MTILNNSTIFELIGLWKVQKLEVNTHVGWEVLMEYGNNLLWDFGRDGNMTEFYTGGENASKKYIWDPAENQVIIEYSGEYDGNEEYRGTFSDIFTGDGIAEGGRYEYAAPGGIPIPGMDYIHKPYADKDGITGMLFPEEITEDTYFNEHFRVRIKNNNEIYLYDLEYIVSEPDDYSFRYLLTRVGIVN